jgi:catechol 2,3-dioxygenase-like lactoylglutathione lyase family enzyme
MRKTSEALTRRALVVSVAACLAAVALRAQAPRADDAARAGAASAVAPDGADIVRVWHLGRVTGDIEPVVRFYRDLGLDPRTDLSKPLSFSTNPTINEFVGVAPAAEFRAVNLTIPGTSAATAPPDQIYLETFELRNVDRQRLVPPLSAVGVSSLRFVVRSLATTVAAARTTGVAAVTLGGEPVPVDAPAGFAGTARAVMVRDPDGYPVEIVEVAPTPATLAPAGSNVLAVQMSLVVADLDVSLGFYRRFVGADLQASAASPWRRTGESSRLWNLPETEFRTASLRLPGSTIVVELRQFRAGASPPYRPAFQDIGFGHVAFIARDMTTVVERMKALGATALSPSGTWTQFNPSLRAIYTRDPDGFFIEVIERR